MEGIRAQPDAGDAKGAQAFHHRPQGIELPAGEFVGDVQVGRALVEDAVNGPGVAVAVHRFGEGEDRRPRRFSGMADIEEFELPLARSRLLDQVGDPGLQQFFPLPPVLPGVPGDVDAAPVLAPFGLEKCRPAMPGFGVRERQLPEAPFRRDGAVHALLGEEPVLRIEPGGVELEVAPGCGPGAQAAVEIGSDEGRAEHGQKARPLRASSE